MNKNMFKTDEITVIAKNRSISMAAAAGALVGLYGAILDERSNVKTILATAAYGAATTALIDSVIDDTPKTIDCYVCFGIVGAATAIVGNYLNSNFGDDITSDL